MMVCPSSFLVVCNFSSWVGVPGSGEMSDVRLLEGVVLLLSVLESWSSVEMVVVLEEEVKVLVLLWLCMVVGVGSFFGFWQ